LSRTVFASLTRRLRKPRRAPAPGVARLRRQRSSEAFRAILPSTFGTACWGLITGIAMVQAGLTLPQAVGMSLLVYSGTTQLTALPLLAGGASLGTIVLTAVLTGLRFIAYSASLSRDIGRLPLARRLMLGYLTSDSGNALYQMRRARETPPQRVTLFVGYNIPVYIAWHLGSLAGIALAASLPADARYAWLGMLAVLVITVPMVASRPAVWAAVSSAIVAILGWNWPWRLGTFAAVVVGVAVALVIERRAQGVRGRECQP
jgi:predicted branched-subunit amino acid permease